MNKAVDNKLCDHNWDFVGYTGPLCGRGKYGCLFRCVKCGKEEER